MANAAGSRVQENVQRMQEIFSGEHVKIQDLDTRPEIQNKKQLQKYLSKDIPNYPCPVQFHIREVAHVTNKTSLNKIWKSGGFKGSGKHSLSWWSLKINVADITSAEELYLRSNRSEEERAAQEPFLRHFTTSPLFLNESSRYGNFRFTFPVHELMEAYRKQMCAGEEPVLRVYATKCFKQEIEYVVLVHSPEFNDQFSDFPELSSSPLVAFKGDQIFWNAYAICETHEYQLKNNGKTLMAERMRSHEFYVWDHVSFVFHINGVLEFSKKRLKEICSSCELPKESNLNLSKGENCSSKEEADKIIARLAEH